MGRNTRHHAGPRDAVPVRHGWAGLYLLNLLGLLLGAAHCPAVCVVDRRQIGESRVASPRPSHRSWLFPSHSSNGAPLLGSTRLQDHVCDRHNFVRERDICLRCAGQSIRCRRRLAYDHSSSELPGHARPCPIQRNAPSSSVTAPSRPKNWRTVDQSQSHLSLVGLQLLSFTHSHSLQCPSAHCTTMRTLSNPAKTGFQQLSRMLSPSTRI